MKRLACSAVVAVFALEASGCATLGHEVGWFAWWDERVERTTEPKQVVVTTDPQGARVSRVMVGQESATGPVEIGAAPLVDVVPLVVEEKTKTPKTGAMWIGTGVEVIAGFAMMILAVASPEDAQGGIDVGRFLGFGMGGGLLVTAGSVDAIVALIHGQRKEPPVRALKGGDVRYVATVADAPPVSLDVRVPEKASAHLVLDVKRSAPKRAASEWIVAVMAVEDAGKVPSTDAEVLAGLGDQLRVYVTQRGARTIDKSAQDSVLKSQIVRIKRESYETCYDSSCQIELGKALAATHILRARASRFGSRCVLNGELVELKTEVTIAAASAQGACEPEGFLQMGEAVARDLISGS